MVKKRNNINIPVGLLESFVEFINGLSSKDINDIIAGNKTIKFKVSSKDKKKEPQITARELLNDLEWLSQFEDLKSKLFTANDREDGLLLLERNCPTKHHLEALAKVLDVPVSKRDSVDHLKRKIIDSTIGFRLRSNAIRGKK